MSASGAERPIAVDTSVVVAAFAAWHERHAEAVALLSRAPRVAAHSILEIYSVLTRLPPPHRMPAETVLEYLRREFPPARRLALSERAQRDAAERLGSGGISGGAVYDGLIALTVAEAGARLVTFDERARLTYERAGAEAVPNG